jgi:molecular chaperone GrpE (heat shock protein)
MRWCRDAGETVTQADEGETVAQANEGEIGAQANEQETATKAIERELVQAQITLYKEVIARYQGEVEELRKRLQDL